MLSCELPVFLAYFSLIDHIRQWFDMKTTKFLLVVVVLVAFVALVPSEAEVCHRWVKLNKSPVCFGAKGNTYGSFTYGKNIFVSSFMLVHRSGTVTCNSKDHSYWGCSVDHAKIATVITDGKKRVLAPTLTGKPSWYNLPGYTSSSSALVFCVQPKTPLCVFSTTEIRLWYAEDLYDQSESDNGGKTCADVYASLALDWSMPGKRFSTFEWPHHSVSGMYQSKDSVHDFNNSSFCSFYTVLWYFVP